MRFAMYVYVRACLLYHLVSVFVSVRVSLLASSAALVFSLKAVSVASLLPFQKYWQNVPSVLAGTGNYLQVKNVSVGTASMLTYTHTGYKHTYTHAGRDSKTCTRIHTHFSVRVRVFYLALKTRSHCDTYCMLC